MNSMCKDCARLNNICGGEKKDLYTGCVYKFKNDGILLPIMEKYFAGYNVPFVLKLTVSHIMRRFNIYGTSDGMYLANVIAYESGAGDGSGHFTAPLVKNHRKIAERLLLAYGCNISKHELDELELMLRTGRIYKESAVKSLTAHIRILRQEKSLDAGGRYTDTTLKRFIGSAAETIDELRGWKNYMPESVRPRYYTPGLVAYDD